MMMPNATAGTISMQLRLDRPEPLHRHRVRGRRATPSARACASIRDGSADVVVAGGTEASDHAAHDLRVRPHGAR